MHFKKVAKHGTKEGTAVNPALSVSCLHKRHFNPKIVIRQTVYPYCNLLNVLHKKKKSTEVVN